MQLDLTIEDDRWARPGIAMLAVTAFAATLAHLGIDGTGCEISLLACDDDRIAALNAEFRDRSAPTNVLSWPAADLAAEAAGAAPRPPVPDIMGETALGDIAIAYDTCAREAEAAGKPLSDHATHLLVHGLLHLLGYDHVRDTDATLMERHETEILGRLGLDDPYRD
ncbi:rRNA maturation RNase YbeY [Pukyongiella litopenaei]|uniref:Endoribonuclease YbeY n=1 Tax=Pukyongiella litopenaei TaxID=2605946 RepID=A0A2S0MQJ9_9RHOB|nr:rRNA maturation RNase YbeY [Pukyongiella litopenaei]AVO38152.1 rRNA maturation RNase YbeY [Pukyongiella litopenaei]